jgi:hypothetical protein
MSAIPFPVPPAAATAPVAPRWRWLPAPDTWKYHALLLSLGIFILGPLGGLTASYMNFSIGFFVGGLGCSARPSPTATASRASTAPTTSRPRRRRSRA